MATVKGSLLMQLLQHVTTTSEVVSSTKLIYACKLYTHLLKKKQKMQISSIPAWNQTSHNFYLWFNTILAKVVWYPTGKLLLQNYSKHSLLMSSIKLIQIFQRIILPIYLDTSGISFLLGIGLFKDSKIIFLTIRELEIGFRINLVLSKKMPSKKQVFKYSFINKGYCCWLKDCRIRQSSKTSGILWADIVWTPSFPWSTKGTINTVQKLGGIFELREEIDEYLYIMMIDDKFE